MTIIAKRMRLNRAANLPFLSISRRWCDGAALNTGNFALEHFQNNRDDERTAPSKIRLRSGALRIFIASNQPQGIKACRRARLSSGSPNDFTKKLKMH